MIDKLERLVDEIGVLHSRLILVVGPPGSGKTRLLRSFGASRGIAPLALGSALGWRLIALSSRQRPIQAAEVLRELILQQLPGDLLLLDNLELLFDETLKLDPLDLLRKQAQMRRVVAVWPGDLHSVGSAQRRAAATTAQRRDAAAPVQRRDAAATAQRRDAAATVQRWNAAATVQRRDAAATVQRRDAAATFVVAGRPGDLHSVGGHSRLTYATLNHPEYEDFAADGVVLLPLET